MNGIMEKQIAMKLREVELKLNAVSVRPLTSHSSRRAHELRWVTTAGERHADPPLPGDVGRLG